MTRNLRVAIYTVVLVCLAASTAWMQVRPEQPSPSSLEYIQALKKLGISPNVLRKEGVANIASWPKDGATGAHVTRLTGLKAGLPRDRMSGAKFVSLAEIKKMQIAPKATGLYLVDVDFVPRDLEQALKAYRFTLKPDGTLLDSNNEPVLALVTSEVYLVEGPRQSSGGAPGSGFSRLLNAVSGLVVPTAEAASPFPFRCYSFTPWAVYHSGFHRWYDARTWAGAYGPDSGGGCSGGSPYTHIDYIQTRAAVSGYGSENHCFYCESEYSRDVWDVGYFWPAHGTPITYHSGVWADGSFAFSRTASLTW